MRDEGEAADCYLGEDLPQQLLLTPLPEDVSNIVIDKLKREADRYWGIDPHRSLICAERIIAIGQVRNDQQQIALGFMAKGDALKLLGETQEAWEALEQAGHMFQAVGDEVGWARTRIGRLYLSTMLDCAPQALDEAERAREIFIRYGEKEKLLRLIYQIAYVHNYLYESSKALELYRTTLQLADELGEVGQAYLGIINASMGTGYLNLGDLRQAEHCYQRARAYYIARGDTLNQAGVEADLGYLAQAQGHYRQGLQLMTRSLESSEAFSELEATKIRWNMLECYLGLNRLPEARDLARQVVASFRDLQDAFELGRALLQLGTIEAELLDYTAAREALSEAETIYTSLDAPSWKALVWLRGGQIALRQGDYYFACQKAQEAGEIFASAHQQINHATAVLLRGQAGLGLDDLDSAANDGRYSLGIARYDNIPALRYTAHLLLGQILEKQGRIERASHHYRAAAATVERIQRGLTISLRPGFLEDKALAWRALIRLCLNDGRSGSAFEILERAKSQVLLGYLANQESLQWAGKDDYSRSLVAKLEQLRAEHQWFYQKAYTFQRSTEGADKDESLQAMEEVRARERRIRQITEQLYLYNEQSGVSNPILAPSLTDVQGRLADDELMIEYYNDGVKLFAFCLTSQSIHIHGLPVTVSALGQWLTQLRLNFSAALQVRPDSPLAGPLLQNALRILRRLFDVLIEPLALQPEKWRRLLFVPYGSLHFLPTHLLYDGKSYLFELFETTVLPAAGLVLQPAPSQRPGAVILAHSWGGRLPNTQTEAKFVHQLFGGKLFSEAAADRLVFNEQPLQILHIAAHGQYRLDQPDLSFIQLNDGQVYADDLFQHDMSYELVTLSACETGRANVSGGDELVGLGRGFLYSGAGALILSLWQVADASTLRLMQLMYQALHSGASKAAALRSAHQVILCESPRLHPAYWGGFQLIGNSKPLSMKEFNSSY